MSESVTVHCAVVGADLCVPKCPLKKGLCMWRHRNSGACMYSKDFVVTPPSPVEFANLVGEVVPNPEVVERVTAKIRNRFKSWSSK